MPFKKPVLVSAGALVAVALLMAPGPAGGAEHGTPGDRVTILYDAFGRDDTMQKDWGFAALIEAGGKRILFDTGNDSEVLAHNVQAAGVDLTRLDFVVMSHRHGDHMGGLNHLLSVNPDVKIYVPQENFGVFGASLPGTFYQRNESLPPAMRYFDGHPPERLHFGTPWPEASFSPVTATTEVAPGFHLIYSKGTWGVDLELMEVSLAIDTPEGIVLVVGCGHPTIERIAAAAREAIDKPIHLIIGGLHLLPAPAEETRRIARALQDEHRVGWIAPGHCTGEPAFGILQQAFAERYVYAGLGTSITLGPMPKASGEE
jgi:7,8-dihydropterin-6-yl-methyl-4-(beta-D-ribofuranosyl)aminobenzene 5'-phosphate synthase